MSWPEYHPGNPVSKAIYRYDFSVHSDGVRAYYEKVAQQGRSHIVIPSIGLDFPLFVWEVHSAFRLLSENGKMPGFAPFKRLVHFQMLVFFFNPVKESQLIERYPVTECDILDIGSVFNDFFNEWFYPPLFQVADNQSIFA